MNAPPTTAHEDPLGVGAAEPAPRNPDDRARSGGGQQRLLAALTAATSAALLAEPRPPRPTARGAPPSRRVRGLRGEAAAPMLPSVLLACAAWAAAPSNAAAQALHAGPNTCVAGYVFRGALPGDQVCVTAAERRNVQVDNAAAQSRIRPGPFGPNQCKDGFVWRLAQPNDLVCVVQAHHFQVLHDNQLAGRRMAANNPIDPNTVPEPQRPGDHTLVLRVAHAHGNSSWYNHKGVPVIGLFTHRSLNCEYGRHVAPFAQGAGASLVMATGWGQVMGTGHPGGGKDPCTSWVTQAAVDFDMTPYTSIPVAKTLTVADLSYQEREAPACITLAYTQGGFAVDPLRCYTNGRGDPESKPNGCVILSVPSEDWVAHPPPGPLQTMPGQFPRMGTSAWNVTDLVNRRLNPPLQMPGHEGPGYGHGFLLVGTPILARRLEAHDNTRCASLLSDLKLTLRYTVAPYTPGRPTVLK